MPNLSLQDKTNIASYMTDILFPDLLEESLLAKQANLSEQQTTSAILGIVASVPGLQPLATGGFLIGGGIALLMSLFTAAEIDTIRGQANETYWLEVKRQLQCALPDSYTDIAWLRDRIARAVENVVPFNGRDIKVRTQANKVLAQAIRIIEPQVFNVTLNYAKTCWQGNENGLRACDEACIPQYAPVPFDFYNTGLLAGAEQITSQVWRLSVNTPTIPGSVYQGAWRLPFAEDCRKVVSVLTVLPPVAPNQMPLAYLTGCSGSEPNTRFAQNLEQMTDQCFNTLRIESQQPFDLYVTIDDCAAAITPTPPVVRFSTNAQTLLEGQSAVARVALFTDQPLAESVTVNLAVDPLSTATLDSDFTMSATAVTFNAGESSGATRDVTINALSDSVDEGNENVVFTLANPTGGAQIGLPNTHVLTITNQWEHVFDFTQGQQGWDLLNVFSYSPGTYVSGEGFRLTFYDMPNNPTLTMLLAGVTFPSANVYRIAYEMDQDGIEGKFHNRNAWIAPNERNAQNTLNFSNRIGSLDVVWGPMSAFAMDLWSNNSTIRTMKNITFYGTGLNPFA
jgi:hypothetical protein